MNRGAGRKFFGGSCVALVTIIVAALLAVAAGTSAGAVEVCPIDPFDAEWLASWRAANGGLDVGATVVDLSTGCRYGFDGDHTYLSASIVKLEILAAVMLRLQDAGSPIDGNLDRLLAPMIEQSDNSATDAVVAWLGGLGVVQDAAIRLGMGSTNSTWAADNWGATLTSTDDQVTLVRSLLVGGGPIDVDHRAIARQYLERVDPSQAWGVGSAAPLGGSALVKNGWYLNLAGGNGMTDRWRLNSVGLVTAPDGRQWSVAVMGDTWPSYSSGVASIEALARRAAVALSMRAPLEGAVVASPDGPVGSLTAVAPTRLLDTRTSGARVAAGGSVEVDVAGGRPGVTAAAVNITVVNPTSPGFVTVFPSEIDVPATSNVNVEAGRTTANLAVSTVGSDGHIVLYTSTAADLVVDLVGVWVAAPLPVSAGRYRATAPTRMLDTRDNGATLAPGSAVRVPVHGSAPGTSSPTVPPTASAVAVSITVASAPNAGFWTVWPGGGAMPLASTVNVRAGDTVANTTIVPVGADGSISVFSQAGGDVVVDIVGWFTGANDGAGSDGLLSSFVSPIRVADSRVGLGISRLDGETAQIPMAPGSGLVGNVTWVSPDRSGYLTVWPSGQAQPLASVANPDPSMGLASSNALIVGRGASGGINMYSQHGTDVVVDLAGVFT